ncbi:MAG: SDR family oxidoreductase [Pseudomonadota bacterium]
MFELNGKTALITGASSGLGAHFSRVLSDAGARVILAARRLDRLESLAFDIAGAGGEAAPVEMDVTDPASVEAAFDWIKQDGGAADIIVNNSGMSRDAFAHEMEEDDWSAVMDTNLTGAWRVAKAGARALIDAGKPGSIINIASITAYGTSQTLGAYAASKAAIDHLTRYMALELARHRIRVNALAPGYFITDLNSAFFETEQGEKMVRRIPMRRTGELHELAGPLLLLASDTGSYMTGSTLVVDGGHLQRGL